MYPSDLTDAQWTVLEPVLLVALAEERRGRHGGGRPRKYPVRRVLEAILYVARTGCQWRALPVNFPPWLSCHQQFRAWRDSGLWEPKRWVVERTLAWLGWNRTLSKDYELNPHSAECFLFLAAAIVLLRRIPSS